MHVVISNLVRSPLSSWSCFRGLLEFLFELYDMAEEYKTPGLKEQVLEDLPSAVNTFDCPGLFYDLVWRRYISDSESGKELMEAMLGHRGILLKA
jgi:hypothetical protein